MRKYALPSKRRSMALATNLTGITSFSGTYPLADLAFSMNNWLQFVGTSAFTQDQGLLTATGPTDEFQATIGNNIPNGLPAGTYHVLNPDGCEIGFGVFRNTQYAAYTKSTDFTFSFPGGTFLGICVRGSMTANVGKLRIIAPGHDTSLLVNGNPWYQPFLDFISGLKPRAIRFMDYNVTSNNIEQTWSQRTTLNKISLWSYLAGGISVPVELQADLVNRIGCDMWTCVPARADANYITQWANTIKANLAPGRRVMMELANEIWNFGSPWAEGTLWMDNLQHTRYTATANVGAGNFTLANHGIPHGTQVRCFETPENRIATDGAETFPMRLGSTSFVDVIDANTFRLRTGSVTGTIVTPITKQVNVMFSYVTEAGKVSDMNTYYAQTCLRNWDIAEPILGGQLVKLSSGQAANSGTTSGRFAVAGMSTRADYATIAPYFTGYYVAGCMDVAGSQLTPKVWASHSMTIHAALYAAGATPSTTDVMAGTGAINKQTVNYTPLTTNAWTLGTAITSLVDGTNYKAIFVFQPLDVGATNQTWRVESTVTPNVNITATSTTSLSISPIAKTLTVQTGKTFPVGAYVTVYRTSDATLRMAGKVLSYVSGTGVLSLDITDSQGSGTFTDWTVITEAPVLDTFDNQLTRHLFGISTDVGYLTSTQAAAGNKPVIAYEGGSHDNYPRPVSVQDWIVSYMEAPQFATQMDRYYSSLAANGMKLHSWFCGDISVRYTVWKIADGYTDTSDVRYQLIASKKGKVTKTTPISLSTLTAADITARPGSFPYAVATFPDATLSYTIVGGNSSGNFTLVGNQLQMTTDTGVNWGIPVLNDITVLASNGKTVTTFETKFFTGQAWYASDALFALDMTKQASTASLTPDVGGALIPAGAQGTLIGGMLDNDTGTNYTTTNAMISSFTLVQPVFVAFVSDKDNQSGLFQTTLTVGSASSITGYTSNSVASFNFRMFGTVPSTDFNVTIPAWDTGAKNVFWVLYDVPNNTIYFGKNQTNAHPNGGQAQTSWPTSLFQRNVTISNTLDKKGSVQVVVRQGLTLAQAKVLVQQMQTLHGIP